MTAVLRPGGAEEDAEAPTRPLSDARRRLVSLDVLRGATIAGMILVNNPGAGPPFIYPALMHAPWNGWTFADSIFPCFLFVSGASMALALTRYLDGERPRSAAYTRIARRVVLLFLLGLIVNAFPRFDLAHLRIWGVLQRISVAYLLAALVVLNTRIRTQVGVAAALLLGYWALLSWARVPGVGAGILTPTGNFAGYVDRSTVGLAHMYHRGLFGYDPEGLLGVLPSVVSVLIGYWAGTWVRMWGAGRTSRARQLGTTGLLAAGTLCLALGRVWQVDFPLNKRLWTSSYVLFMAGWCLLALALCRVAFDGGRPRPVRWLARPFEVLGANAIVVYVGSELTNGALSNTYHRLANGRVLAWSEWIWERELRPWAGALHGSALYAVAILALWWVIAAVLYRRHWFVRV